MINRINRRYGGQYYRDSVSSSVARKPHALENAALESALSLEGSKVDDLSPRDNILGSSSMARTAARGVVHSRPILNELLAVLDLDAELDKEWRLTPPVQQDQM